MTHLEPTDKLAVFFAALALLIIFGLDAMT